MGVGKREETNSIGSKGASVYALYEKTPIIILEVEVFNTFEDTKLTSSQSSVDAIEKQ